MIWVTIGLLCWVIAWQRGRIAAQNRLIHEQRIGLKLDEELLALHGIWKREP